MRRIVNPEINALLMHEEDNVVVVLEEINEGQVIRYASAGVSKEIKAVERIPIYHKVARNPIPAKKIVCKYGGSIGASLRDIEPGEHVHEHNLCSLRDDCRK